MKKLPKTISNIITLVLGIPLTLGILYLMMIMLKYILIFMGWLIGISLSFALVLVLLSIIIGVPLIVLQKCSDTIKHIFNRNKR